MNQDHEADILRILGEVLDLAEGPPPISEEMAASLLDLHRIDGELLELVETTSLAGVRGDSPWKSYSFSGPIGTIELDLDLGERLIIGQLDPPLQANVEVVGGTTGAVAEVDDLGRFQVGFGDARSIRVRVTTSGRPFVTPIMSAY